MADIEETTQRTLSKICSALEYLIDRGEIEHIVATITEVRWQTPEPLVDHIDLIAGEREIRITAQDLGPHEHDFDDSYTCKTCRVYLEEEDL